MILILKHIIFRRVEHSIVNERFYIHYIVMNFPSTCMVHHACNPNRAIIVLESRIEIAKFRRKSFRRTAIYAIYASLDLK